MNTMQNNLNTKVTIPTIVNYNTLGYYNHCKETKSVVQILERSQHYYTMVLGSRTLLVSVVGYRTVMVTVEGYGYFSKMREDLGQLSETLFYPNLMLYINNEKYNLNALGDLEVQYLEALKDNELYFPNHSLLLNLFIKEIAYA